MRSWLVDGRRRPYGRAHELDCEAVSDECRFIVQSENEEEAIELAKNHVTEVHGRELTNEELREEHLQVV
jgi:predicted small metal-binding protein